MSYARIGYHYAVPGCTDDHMPITREDVRPLALPETWAPAARMGARDSVFFEAEDVVVVGERDAGEREKESDTRYLGGAIWTRGAALLWLPEAAGAKKTFVLKADEAGRMRLHVTFAMTHNSGRVSATLNGKPVKWDGGDESGILDLRAPHRVLSRVFSLPPIDLETGDQMLVLKFEGAADGIIKPEIGIDFIWLQKAAN